MNKTMRRDLYDRFTSRAFWVMIGSVVTLWQSEANTQNKIIGTTTIVVTWLVTNAWQKGKDNPSDTNVNADNVQVNKE